MTDDLSDDDDDQIQMGRGDGMNEEDDDLEMEMDPRQANRGARQRGTTGGQRQQPQQRAQYAEDDDF